ncbi:hypothetical protein HMPREF3206_01018 [Fusobacterium equinum]|uniref:Uncharacterized protein n=1 Tax=Fusobacterium equinum TaxID=134605 RepID=A0A133NDJ4_9FUSO|nr:hypothetical protein HMPREF3206_01018 [Fusobacterium equinum]
MENFTFQCVSIKVKDRPSPYHVFVNFTFQCVSIKVYWNK